MLFSPYFPIRFKGVFMAYLYMHIPQIFPTGFFEESKLTVDLKEDSIKGECCEPTQASSLVKRRLLTV
jgi:hypothetical protein